MDTFLPGRIAPKRSLQEIDLDCSATLQHLLLVVGPEHDEGAVEGAGRGRQLSHSPHQHHQQAEDQPWADGRIRKGVIRIKMS